MADVTAEPGLALPITQGQHDAFRAALEGPALRSIIAVRREQLAKGHDAEADSFLAIDALPVLARDYLQIAVECVRGINGERDLIRAKKKLAHVGALVMAAIDRIDVAMGGDDGSVG